MSDLGTHDFTVTELPPDSKIGGNSESTPEPPVTRGKRDTELIVQGLKKFYYNTGMMLFIVSPEDGTHIAKNADDLGESWRSLLDSDAKLRKRMLTMLEAGGWSQVIVAHVLVAIPIMRNHGVSLEHLIKRKATSGMESEEGGSGE